MRKATEKDGKEKNELLPMMPGPPPFAMNNNINSSIANNNCDNLLTRLNAFLPQMAAANQGA